MNDHTHITREGLLKMLEAERAANADLRQQLTAAREAQTVLQEAVTARDAEIDLWKRRHDLKDEIAEGARQEQGKLQDEIERLRAAAKRAMDFIDYIGEASPIVFGNEAAVYHELRNALGYDSEHPTE